MFRIARALEVPLSALVEVATPPAARRIPARSGTALNFGRSFKSACRLHWWMPINWNWRCSMWP